MRCLRITLLVLAAEIVHSNLLIAQVNNEIKFNLLSPIAKTATFFYERNISDKVGAQIGLSYTNFNISHAGYEGFGYRPELRIYPTESENFKAFIAPFMTFQTADLFTITYDGNNNEKFNQANYLNIGGGIVLGSKITLDDFAVMEIFAGPAYNKGDLDIISGKNEDFGHLNLALDLFSDLTFRIGFNIGIAF